MFLAVVLNWSTRAGLFDADRLLDLTCANTHWQGVGVGTSQVPCIFLWAEISRELDGYY